MRRKTRFPGLTNFALISTLLVAIGMAGCDSGSVNSLPPATCEVPGAAGDINEAVIHQAITASQVVENGLPQRKTEIGIPFSEPVLLCDAQGLSLEVDVKDPLSGHVRPIPINVLSSTVQGNTLKLVVDGPVSTGSQLRFAPGSLLVGERGLSLNGAVTLNGVTPAEAALWGKAYEPTSANLFPPSIYGGEPSQGIPQPTDPAVVRQDLAGHFQRFVAAGKMTGEKMNEMLRFFENEEYRQIFINPETGQFEPQLMAMVLATAGTPGEGSIAAIIGGRNQTGRPAQVRYADLPASRLGQAEVIQDANGQDQWVITMNSRMRNEPFQVGSVVMAHEAFHQDLIQGQDEEVIAKSAGINTWKQQVFVNPELASIGTGASKFMNLQVLIHENSGQSFPNGGIFEAPLAQGTQDVVPNSSALDSRSLEDFLRNNVYADVEDINTPGNRYLDSYLIHTGNGSSGNPFNNQTVAVLDNPQFFTTEENFKILQALQLQPVITL